MSRRIAIVTSWFPSATHPAAGVFVREQAQALASVGDVAVIFPDGDAPARHGAWTVTEGNEDGLRVLRVNVRALRIPILSGMLNVAAVRAALRRLERSGWVPDILHAHVHAAGLLALAARRAGTPVVVTEHLSAFRLGTVSGLDRRLARLVFARADLVCPVSAELAVHLRALGASAPMRVVPNVVDTRCFHPAARPRRGGPIRALVVAALRDIKQVDVLLEALAIIHADAASPCVELDIVGDGPLMPALREQATAQGIGHLVRFHGHKTKDDVAELMRSADLFVLPSRSENMPVVLLEAMASGLPIVATRVGGVPEIVEVDAGVLATPGEPAELAAAIADVARRLDEFDPAKLHARAVERYGAPAVARRLGELYDALIRGTPLPA